MKRYRSNEKSIIAFPRALLWLGLVTCVAITGATLAQRGAIVEAVLPTGSNYSNLITTLSKNVTVATNSRPKVAAAQPSCNPANACSGTGFFWQPNTVAAMPYENQNGILLTGDFNADGARDVVHINDNSISTFLWNPATTKFNAPLSQTLAELSYAGISGDFNQDSKLDLAVIKSGEVTILSGNQNGTFTEQGVYAVNTATQLVTGDFNGDSLIDIVAATADSRVALLTGNGNGTFLDAEFHGFTQITSCRLNLVTADFNGDGITDVAARACSSETNGATVFITFGSATGFENDVAYQLNQTLDPNTLAITTGDFNGDGKPDIASNTSSSAVAVLLNSAATPGTFTQLSELAIDGEVFHAADFNGDCKDDVLVRINSPHREIALLFGAANGALNQVNYLFDFTNGLMVVGDFPATNGNASEGKPDLVLAGYQNQPGIVLFQNQCTASNTPLQITPPSPSLTFQQGKTTSNVTLATYTPDEFERSFLSSFDLQFNNLQIEGGTVVSNILASCSAATGSQSFPVIMTRRGGVVTKTTIPYTMTANPPPTLGTYANTSVNAGANTTVSPSAAPSDDGGPPTMTVTASAGFQGTVSVSAAGVVIINNASPVGSHTITVKATDSCDLMATKTFVLTVNSTVNTPPTIIPSSPFGLTQGGAVYRQIATVRDDQTLASNLTVTANAPAGVTVTNIFNSNGAISAEIFAYCSALVGGKTMSLTVSDGALTATTNFPIYVDPNSLPSLGNYLSYPGAHVFNEGTSGTINPSSFLADDNAVPPIVTVDKTIDFTGDVTVDARGILSVSNAGPSGYHTFIVTASDRCGLQAVRTATVYVCGTISPSTLPQPYLGIHYDQLLLAKPAASYSSSTVTGALPPGLQLVKWAEGVYTLRGTPTVPGIYTFTITAVGRLGLDPMPCPSSRTYTITVPTTVVPILECVQRNANGSYTARFGYENTGAAVTIPVGANNSFVPGNHNQGQTTVFQPGRRNAFSVTFPGTSIWSLRGPDGVLRSVQALPTTNTCP